MPVTNTTHGCRGWDDWAPKEPTSRTDKTDKSPSVSFVSSSPGPFTGEIGHSDPQTPQPMVIASCGVSPDEKSLKATATAGCSVVAVENWGSGDETFFDADLKTHADFTSRTSSPNAA